MAMVGMHGCLVNEMRHSCVCREMSRVTRAAEADLADLYDHSYPRFMRVAMAMLGDPELARDAVHDTFVLAVSGLARFRAESSLETWVWRILTNACLSEKRREVVLLAEPEEHAEPVASEWPEVRIAVAGLPERQRTVLFLRHYADLDYEQIAATLGIERGTVAATLHAAHQKLRDILQEVPR